MSKVVVTFGEVMGRFCPAGNLRFAQCMPGNLELTFGGAEANVAASVSNLGGRSRFVTALPDNDITKAFLRQFKGLDVDLSRVLVRDAGRFGLYFVETGANQRPSNVIYDREGSTVCITESDCYDWDAIFADAGWFHISGITPAISKAAAAAALDSVKAASKNGVTVSCDLNFRKKLWKWDASFMPRELAESTMRKMLPFVDVVIGNEEDASDVLGITAGSSDVESGKLDVAKYQDVARKIVEQFPNVKKVAITLRESISATHNNWGAMLFDTKTDKAMFAPENDGEYSAYEIRNIIDRVGGGDSFSAGLVFALNEGFDNKMAIKFAVASSCLAHSIKGDINFSNRKEVESLMNGSGSGRVVR